MKNGRLGRISGKKLNIDKVYSRLLPDCSFLRKYPKVKLWQAKFMEYGLVKIPYQTLLMKTFLKKCGFRGEVIVPFFTVDDAMS